MPKKLSADGFAVYAREQINDATRVLATHRRTALGCGCGRPLPCPVADRWSRHVAHFKRQLALAETQMLPFLSLPRLHQR